MKKLILCLAALLLALTVCFTVLAESNTPKVYDSLINLLFATNNVTVTAKAEFSLDGEWFKTAEGTWRQDYSRSFRELVLRAPKADGSERRNGYTIVTEDEKLYLMEAFTPGVYKEGNNYYFIALIAAITAGSRPLSASAIGSGFSSMTGT